MFSQMQMAFVSPNQQFQSSEGNTVNYPNQWSSYILVRGENPGTPRAQFSSPSLGGDTPLSSTACRPPDGVAKPWNGVLGSKFRLSTNERRGLTDAHNSPLWDHPDTVADPAHWWGLEASLASPGCMLIGRWPVARPRGRTRPQPRVRQIRHTIYVGPGVLKVAG